jgi:hypothetical protein
LRSLLIRPHASSGLLRPTRSYGRTRHSAIHGQLAHTAARVMTPCGPCSYGRTRHPASYGQLAHTAARVIRPLAAKLPMLQRASRPLWSSLIRPHASFGHPRPTRSYGRTRHDPLRSLLIRPHASSGLLRPTRSYGRTRHPLRYRPLPFASGQVALAVHNRYIRHSRDLAFAALLCLFRRWELHIGDLYLGRKRKASGRAGGADKVKTYPGFKRSGARICICARFMWGGLSQSKRRSV